VIISLRGTNGAGKSTIVRSILHESHFTEIRSEDRRKPVGYICSPRDHHAMKKTFIPGHYEIQNGGIDTLKSLDAAYDMIRSHWLSGHHVLYEGKNMTDRTSRIREFPVTEVIIIVIDHPVELCIEAVRARGHSIRQQTIEKIARYSAIDADRLAVAGYEVLRLDRDAAIEKVREVIRG